MGEVKKSVTIEPNWSGLIRAMEYQKRSMDPDEWIGSPYEKILDEARIGLLNSVGKK